jgi:hypothetical protein
VVSNDRSTRRSSAALIGALALHGLALLVTLHTHDSISASGEPAGAPTPTIEVEMSDNPVAAQLAEPTSSPPDERLAASLHQGRNHSSDRGNVSATASATDPGSASATAAGTASPTDPGTSPAPNGDYSLNPAAPGSPEKPEVDLGIAPGNWSRWTKPGAPAAEPVTPRPAPAPVSTTGGLAEALEAHDQGVGLGPGGAVLSAAHEAAHSDVAPQLGRATFAITVLSTGSVDVQLVGASSNVDGWQKVAANMAASIKRKPPKINPPRNGARIGVELVAEERWPNGALARTEGPKVAVIAPSFKAVDKAQEELATRNPAAIPPPGSPVEQPSLTANVDLPGIFLEGKGKVCSYKIGLTPFGLGASGGCDPSNIGAPAQRVVSARVLSESMF